MTGKTPSALMMNRTARGKIPTLKETHDNVDCELLEKDGSMKEKGKRYGDARHRARLSKLQVGDNVLVKRIKKHSKLSSNYLRQPFKILKRKGGEAIVQSESGVQYKRNISHLKHYPHQRTHTSPARQNQDRYTTAACCPPAWEADATAPNEIVMDSDIQRPPPNEDRESTSHFAPTVTSTP